MIEKAGINYRELDDEKFDEPFDIGSGAGAIFGATGGVMEAALRTAAEVILGTKLEKLDFDDVRGTAPIKTATYKLGDTEVRVAVASGTKNARELLNKVKAGELEVDFIEIMACPGGCVNGGGQPVQSAAVKAAVDLKAKRASILYNADKIFRSANRTRISPCRRSMTSISKSPAAISPTRSCIRIISSADFDKQKTVLKSVPFFFLYQSFFFYQSLHSVSLPFWALIPACV